MVNFLKQHPTLSITLVYLFISCFGLVYLYLLSSQFKISILPHLEITDFILAPINHPLSVIVFVVCIGGIRLSLTFDQKIRKVKKLSKLNNKLNSPFFVFNPLLTYGTLVILAVFAGIYASSVMAYDDVIDNKKQRYTVALSTKTYVNGKPVEQLQQIQIIADTVKYLWVYLNENEELHAIPQKNIATLIPITTNKLLTEQ